MKADELSRSYRAYIDCLNRRDLQDLDRFVHDDVHYNGERIGLSGYRKMLYEKFEDIPDLLFRIDLLLTDVPYVASRLAFDCTPRTEFLGLQINGRRVSFAENVFYEFRDNRIANVWSVIV